MNSFLHITVLLMILEKLNGQKPQKPRQGLFCTRLNYPIKKNARIYKGREAKKNAFPWYIDLEVEYPSIKDPEKPKENLKIEAGGSLISKYHILTVAHIFQQ